MAQPKRPERLQLKMAPEDRALLEELAATLGVDMSHAIRLTVREKCRSLGIEVPTVPIAKKKRRAAP